MVVGIFWGREKIDGALWPISFFFLIKHENGSSLPHVMVLPFDTIGLHLTALPKIMIHFYVLWMKGVSWVIDFPLCLWIKSCVGSLEA